MQNEHHCNILKLLPTWKTQMYFWFSPAQGNCDCTFAESKTHRPKPSPLRFAELLSRLYSTAFYCSTLLRCCSPPPPLFFSEIAAQYSDVPPRLRSLPGAESASAALSGQPDRRQTPTLRSIREWVHACVCMLVSCLILSFCWVLGLEVFVRPSGLWPAQPPSCCRVFVSRSLCSALLWG